MATPEPEPTAAQSGETVLYSRESFIALRNQHAQWWQGCLERLSRKVKG
jgi:hypothetical protein